MPLIKTVRVDLAKLFNDPHDPPYFVSVVPPMWLTFDKIDSFNKISTKLTDANVDINEDAELRGAAEDIFQELFYDWNLTEEVKDAEGNYTDEEVPLVPPRRRKSNIWKVPTAALWEMLNEANRIVAAEGDGAGGTIPLGKSTGSSVESVPQTPELPSTPQEQPVSPEARPQIG